MFKPTHIEGMEPPTVADIDQAAEAFLEIRNRRMDLTEQETARNRELMEAMKRHGLESYEFPNGDNTYVVTVSKETVETVKVARKKPEKKPSTNGQE